MPLYEYQCDACGNRFEVIRKFSDAPLEICPKCGGHIQKLISAPAFQLKGTGWYATDFSGKKPSEGQKAEAKEGKEGKTQKEESKSSEGKTEGTEGKSQKAEGKSEGGSGKVESKNETAPAKTESPAPAAAPTKD